MPVGARAGVSPGRARGPTGSSSAHLTNPPLLCPASTCALLPACSWWVLTKGAPETVRSLLGIDHIPKHFDQTYKVGACLAFDG